MLFNVSNLRASADGLEWNDRTWSIVNHFIPYTETEVNSPERFESDFMVQYLRNLTGLGDLSGFALAVLAEGKNYGRPILQTPMYVQFAMN